MSRMDPEHIAAARKNLAEVWQKTQDFAKRKGLEHFLDKPLELNHLILDMLYLLNKLQFSEQRHKYEEENLGKEQKSNFISRYAQGKFTLSFNALGDHDDKANLAFSSAVDIYTILDHAKFIQTMRRQNVPEEIIQKYLKDYDILEDCYCSEQHRS